MNDPNIDLLLALRNILALDYYPHGYESNACDHDCPVCKALANARAALDTGLETLSGYDAAQYTAAIEKQRLAE